MSRIKGLQVMCAKAIGIMQYVDEKEQVLGSLELNVVWIHQIILESVQKLTCKVFAICLVELPKFSSSLYPSYTVLTAIILPGPPLPFTIVLDHDNVYFRRYFSLPLARSYIK